ncbi:MAG: ABC transporter ATP-binding protein/permease [Defluviitaleaceae bacterium]|nr:ABC transporter ATP-binding protein/permease [Defluviitaleaceae bacterium]
MKAFMTTLKRVKLRYRRFILLYILAATVTAVAAVAMRLLSGEMSEAALQGDLEALTRFILLMTGVLVLRAAASAASTFISMRVSARANYTLRTLFINHFLRAPFAALERTPSGEQLSIYSNDIPQTESLVASGLLGLVTDFISFVAAFAFLIIISPAFTGVLIAAAVGMLVLQLLLSLPLQKWSVKMSEEQAKFNAVVNDSLQNLSVVVAYSLEDVLEARYMNAYGQFFAVLKRFAKALGVTLGAMLAILLSPLVVVVVVLALATIDGNLTLVEFIAFSTTILAVAGGLTGMAQQVSGLSRAAGSAKRFNQATADAPEALEHGGAPQNGVISFKNVTFAYNQDAGENEAKPEPPKKKKLGISFGGPPPDETPPAEAAEALPTAPTLALDSVSFDIATGSKVGIVGGSGSGKSTILKLLLGLYEPTGGQITIGGQDAAGFAKSHLRELFAYVPQNSFLFPESIGKNIALEEIMSDMPRLEKACADAGILDFINTLPDKFDGVLTEAADNVSGGQRQRIAMARAFYKDAPVILFDEATSSLDPATEAAVLDSFAAASSDKTVIIVAHRASAIAGCDTIITMDGGKISSIEKKGATS